MKRLHSLLSRLAAFVAMLALSSPAAAQGIGSQAQLWKQKSRAEQLSYLDGYCEGLKVTEASFGAMTCYAQGEPANGRQLFRFCGAVNSENGRVAIAFLDAFYRDQKHSDVPLWAATVSYNDRACGEQNTEGKLEALQREGECMRQLTALLQLKVEQSVINAHIQNCKAKR